MAPTRTPLSLDARLAIVKRIRLAWNAAAIASDVVCLRFDSIGEDRRIKSVLGYFLKKTKNWKCEVREGRICDVLWVE